MTKQIELTKEEIQEQLAETAFARIAESGELDGISIADTIQHLQSLTLTGKEAAAILGITYTNFRSAVANAQNGANNGAKDVKSFDLWGRAVYDADTIIDYKEYRNNSPHVGRNHGPSIADLKVQAAVCGFTGYKEATKSQLLAAFNRNEITADGKVHAEQVNLCEGQAVVGDVINLDDVSDFSDLA